MTMGSEIEGCTQYGTALFGPFDVPLLFTLALLRGPVRVRAPRARLQSVCRAFAPRARLQSKRAPYRFDMGPRSRAITVQCRVFSARLFFSRGSVFNVARLKKC